MGKTLVYIALLGILGFGVYYFLFRNSEGLYQEKEANFTFKDTASIGKIFLVESDGASILVERGASNQWIVNKKYPAMPIQMVNILTCLRLQTALTPVSEKDHDKVVKMLAGMGTKVEVYDRQGSKIRTFYVAGQGPNYHGSFMILEGADQPYLVEVPGFEGYLTPRYATELNEWRSRSVFNYTAQELASVSVSYPDEPLNSFTVNNSSSGPHVALHPELAASLKEQNDERVRSYMDFFTNINAEGYLNGVADMDSIIRSSVLRCKITVTPKKGNETALDIYWVDISEKHKSMLDQTSTDPKHRPTDVDRLYAVNLSTHDTLLIQRQTFDKLFRSGFEFFQKDDPAQRPRQPNITPLNKKKAPINYVK